MDIRADYWHYPFNSFTTTRYQNSTTQPELPAEITLKPYGDPRNVMISR